MTPERITEPGLTLSWFAYFGAVPCVASKTACPVSVVDVAARRDADAADLRRQRVGQVVAVQVQGRDHVELVGARQALLEHDVGDRVLHQDLPRRRLRRRSRPTRSARPWYSFLTSS